MTSLPVHSDRYPFTLIPDADLWVFAYGSLMWDPGFEFLDRQMGLLRGYHRSFCIASIRHRGTPEQPGLVFGLDHGGSCRGILYRIGPDAAATVLDLLWDREMVSRVYLPRLLPVRLDQNAVPAVSFVVDRRHPQYCGKLGLSEAAARIRQGIGGRGPNADYLINTVEHLKGLGIRDYGLEALLDMVKKA